jgi:large subunit ribosomal protein L28
MPQLSKDYNMPRVCKVTGKKTQVGMNVSHSERHTKRTFLPNLQKLKFHSDILNRDFSLRISTAGLRTLTKHGGLDAYVMSKSPSRLTPEMAAIKKAINKKIGKPEKPAKKPAHKANRSARLVKKVESRKAATK